MAKTGGHYPAPLVAVDIVRDGLKLPLRRALDLEAGAFSELVVSDTAKSLISIFFTKNDVEARAAKIAKKARPVETVGVLGAGFMGAGIAQVLAYKGLPIILKDRDLPSVGRGYGFCRQQFRELVKRRRLSDAAAKNALGRILPHGRLCRSAARGLRRRGRVRGSGGQAANVHPRDGSRGGDYRERADLRLQHLLDPHRQAGRGEPPAGERGGHALLQPRGQDAAPGDHPPPRHLARRPSPPSSRSAARWARR